MPAASTFSKAIVSRMDRALYPRDRDRWDVHRFVEYARPHLKSSFTLLDFGAGRGTHPEFDFRPFANRVLGVDVDEAVRSNPHLHASALLEPPHYAIPYGDNCFDAIVASNVVEHLPDPVATFREMERVLQPGGVVLLKTTNRRHYVATIARLTPDAFHRWVMARRGVALDDVFPTTYRCNTIAALRRAARAASLDVVDITLHEGRPEYLRGNPVTYAVGFLYERIVNATPRLSGFRAVMLATLRKPLKE